MENKIQRLIKNLELSKIVNSLDDKDEKEADRLSHSLIDMEDSFNKIYNNLLKKLMRDDLKEEDVDDILFDIGEELRHILYHIKDPKFFNYIIEE